MLGPPRCSPVLGLGPPGAALRGKLPAGLEGTLRTGHLAEELGEVGYMVPETGMVRPQAGEMMMLRRVLLLSWMLATRLRFTWMEAT